jgi:hypothetical protein
VRSPFLRTDEAALYLRFTDAEGRPNRRALMKFLARKKVPIVTRGRRILIHEDDLKAALDRRVAS